MKLNLINMKKDRKSLKATQMILVSLCFVCFVLCFSIALNCNVIGQDAPTNIAHAAQIEGDSSIPTFDLNDSTKSNVTYGQDSINYQLNSISTSDFYYSYFVNDNNTDNKVYKASTSDLADYQKVFKHYTNMVTSNWYERLDQYSSGAASAGVTYLQSNKCAYGCYQKEGYPPNTKWNSYLSLLLPKYLQEYNGSYTITISADVILMKEFSTGTFGYFYLGYDKGANKPTPQTVNSDIDTQVTTKNLFGSTFNQITFGESASEGKNGYFSATYTTGNGAIDIDEQNMASNTYYAQFGTFSVSFTVTNEKYITIGMGAFARGFIGTILTNPRMALFNINLTASGFSTENKIKIQSDDISYDYYKLDYLTNSESTSLNASTITSVGRGNNTTVTLANPMSVVVAIPKDTTYTKDGTIYSYAKEGYRFSNVTVNSVTSDLGYNSKQDDAINAVVVGFIDASYLKWFKSGMTIKSSGSGDISRTLKKISEGVEPSSTGSNAYYLKNNNADNSSALAINSIGRTYRIIYKTNSETAHPDLNSNYNDNFQDDVFGVEYTTATPEDYFKSNGAFGTSWQVEGGTKIYNAGAKYLELISSVHSLIYNTKNNQVSLIAMWTEFGPTAEGLTLTKTEHRIANSGNTIVWAEGTYSANSDLRFTITASKTQSVLKGVYARYTSGELNGTTIALEETGSRSGNVSYWILYGICGNCTIFPVWQTNSYTITYNENSYSGKGTISATTPASFIYGVGINYWTLPYVTGTGTYIFKGWSEKSDGSSLIYKNGNEIMFADRTSNVTLYAVFNNGAKSQMNISSSSNVTDGDVSGWTTPGNYVKYATSHGAEDTANTNIFYHGETKYLIGRNDNNGKRSLYPALYFYWHSNVNTNDLGTDSNKTEPSETSCSMQGYLHYYVALTGDALKAYNTGSTVTVKVSVGYQCVVYRYDYHTISSRAHIGIAQGFSSGSTMNNVKSGTAASRDSDGYSEQKDKTLTTDDLELESQSIPGFTIQLRADCKISKRRFDSCEQQVYCGFTSIKYTVSFSGISTEYTLNLAANGGTGTKSNPCLTLKKTSAYTDSDINSIGSPWVKTGYRFDGWTITTSGNNKTATAKWVKICYPVVVYDSFRDVYNNITTIIKNESYITYDGNLLFNPSNTSNTSYAYSGDNTNLYPMAGCKIDPGTEYSGFTCYQSVVVSSSAGGVPSAPTNLWQATVSIITSTSSLTKPNKAIWVFYDWSLNALSVTGGTYTDNNKTYDSKSYNFVKDGMLSYVEHPADQSYYDVDYRYYFSQSTLPSEYTQVDYLESTGTQYINTGVNPYGKQITWIIDGQFVTTGAQHMGAFSGQRMHISIWNNGYHPGLGNGYGCVQTLNTSRHQFELDYLGNFSVDGIAYNYDTWTSGAVTSSFDLPNINLFLFALNRSGTAGDYSSFKMYSCKIYNGSELIRDFVPCVNSSNPIKAGLFDKVTKVFYGNNGTGDFSYGSSVSTNYYNYTFGEVSLPKGYSQVEYIQSFGSQWIDTNIKIKENTNIVADLMFTDKFDYNMVYGAWAQFSLSLKGSGDVCAACGGINTQSSGNSCLINTRYNIIHKAGSLTIGNSTVSLGSKTNSVSSRHILLFAASDGSTGNSPYAWTSYGKCKIYSFKIYEDASLVGDFVPCVNESTKKAGMYDLVSKVFFSNKGTGDFYAGPNITYNNNVENDALDSSNENREQVLLTGNGAYSGEYYYHTKTIDLNEVCIPNIKDVHLSGTFYVKLQFVITKNGVPLYTTSSTDASSVIKATITRRTISCSEDLYNSSATPESIWSTGKSTVVYDAVTHGYKYTIGGVSGVKESGMINGESLTFSAATCSSQTVSSGINNIFYTPEQYKPDVKDKYKYTYIEFSDVTINGTKYFASNYTAALINSSTNKYTDNSTVVLPSTVYTVSSYRFGYGREWSVTKRPIDIEITWSSYGDSSLSLNTSDSKYHFSQYNGMQQGVTKVVVKNYVDGLTNVIKVGKSNAGQGTSSETRKGTYPYEREGTLNTEDWYTGYLKDAGVDWVFYIKLDGAKSNNYFINSVTEKGTKPTNAPSITKDSVASGQTITFVIAKRKLTISWTINEDGKDGNDYLYNGNALGVTGFTIDNFLSGEATSDVLSITYDPTTIDRTTASTATNRTFSVSAIAVNTYRITISLNNDSKGKNYELTGTPWTQSWKIIKRPIYITVSTKSDGTYGTYTYNGAHQGPRTIVISNMPDSTNGDPLTTPTKTGTFTLSSPSKNTTNKTWTYTVSDAINAGSYEIAFALSSGYKTNFGFYLADSGYGFTIPNDSSNTSTYLNSATTSWTINKKALKVSPIIGSTWYDGIYNTYGKSAKYTYESSKYYNCGTLKDTDIYSSSAYSMRFKVEMMVGSDLDALVSAINTSDSTSGFYSSKVGSWDNATSPVINIWYYATNVRDGGYLAAFYFSTSTGSAFLNYKICYSDNKTVNGAKYTYVLNKAKISVTMQDTASAYVSGNKNGSYTYNKTAQGVKTVIISGLKGNQVAKVGTSGSESVNPSGKTAANSVLLTLKNLTATGVQDGEKVTYTICDTINATSITNNYYQIVCTASGNYELNTSASNYNATCGWYIAPKALTVALKDSSNVTVNKNTTGTKQQYYYNGAGQGLKTITITGLESDDSASSCVKVTLSDNSSLVGSWTNADYTLTTLSKDYSGTTFNTKIESKSSNYTIDSGTEYYWTIIKLPITCTVISDECTYDGKNHTLSNWSAKLGTISTGKTYTYGTTTVVPDVDNGQIKVTFANGTVELIKVGGLDKYKNVGTYSLTNSLVNAEGFASLSNYAYSETGSGTLTIKAREITATWTIESSALTYNADNQELASLAVTNVVKNETPIKITINNSGTISDISRTVTSTITDTLEVNVYGKNAKTYTFSVALDATNGGGNYKLIGDTSNKTKAINKYSITIEHWTIDKTDETANQMVVGAGINKLNGVTYSSPYYNLPSTTSAVYDGDAFGVRYKLSPLLPSEYAAMEKIFLTTGTSSDVTVSTTSWSACVNYKFTAKNAGTYDIYLKFGSDSIFDNYQICYKDDASGATGIHEQYIITARPLSITWSTESGNLTYNSESQTLRTATLSTTATGNPIIGSDSPITVTSTTDSTYAFADNVYTFTAEHHGTYDMSISLKSGEKNYTLTTSSSSRTIDQKLISFEWKTCSCATGSPFTRTVMANPSTTSVGYSGGHYDRVAYPIGVYDDDLTSFTITYTKTTTTNHGAAGYNSDKSVRNAGVYGIAVNKISNEDYKFNASSTTLEVTRKEIFVTVYKEDGKTVLYNTGASVTAPSGTTVSSNLFAVPSNYSTVYDGDNHGVVIKVSNMVAWDYKAQTISWDFTLDGTTTNVKGDKTDATNVSTINKTYTAKNAKSSYSYSALLKGGNAPNYFVRYSGGQIAKGVSSSFEITKRPLTLTWSNESNKTYNATSQEITDIIASNIVSGETPVKVEVVKVEGNETITGEEKTINSVLSLSHKVYKTNALTYTIKVTQTDKVNYTAITEESKNIGIDKAPLTVTAKPKTITYGDAGANDGVTYTGFKGSDNESNALTGTLSYAYNAQADNKGAAYVAGSNVGTYKIIPSGLSAVNYNITFVAGDLTVNKRTLVIGSWTMSYTDGTKKTISSSPYTCVYNKNDVEMTTTISNKYGSDDISLTYTDNTKINVGSYSAKVSGLSGAKKDNYQLNSDATSRTQAWSITEREVTLTWSIISAKTGSTASSTLTQTYNTYKWTVTATAGNVCDGDTITITSYTGNENTNASETAYTATATGISDGNTKCNYKLPSLASTNYTINKAKVYVKSTTNYDVYYISANYAHRYYYKFNNGTYQDVAIKGTPTKPCGATYEQDTLRWEFEYDVAYSDNKTTEKTKSQPLNSGTYKATITLTSATNSSSEDTKSNYVFEQTDVPTGNKYTIKVKQIPVTIKWSETGSFEYDGTAKNREIESVSPTVSETTAINASKELNVSLDGFTVKLYQSNSEARSETLTFSLSGSAINKGDYESEATLIKVNNSTSSIKLANYVISNVDSSYSIIPLPVKLSWELTCEDSTAPSSNGPTTYSAIYNAKKWTMTATVENIPTGGSTCTVTAYTSNGNTTNIATNHSDNVYVAQASTLSSGNYTLEGGTNVSMNWTIAKRIVLVEIHEVGTTTETIKNIKNDTNKPNDVSYTEPYYIYGTVVRSRTYDGAVHGVRYKFMNIVAGEKDSFKDKLLTTGSSVGYTIVKRNQSADAKDADKFNIDYKAYSAGTYTACFNFGTEDLFKNYQLKYKNDDSGATGVKCLFEIEKRELTVSWSNESNKTYNGSTQEVTKAIVSNIVSKEKPVKVEVEQVDPKSNEVITGVESTESGVVELTHTISKTNAATYSIKVTLTDTTNYSISGDLTKDIGIDKEKLTVTANPHTITYGDAGANNGVDYSGFKGSDTESVLIGTLSYSYNTQADDKGTSYVAGSNAGTYYIIPSGLSAVNYEITFKEGTLTVNKAKINIQVYSLKVGSSSGAISRYYLFNCFTVNYKYSINGSAYVVPGSNDTASYKMGSIKYPATGETVSWTYNQKAIYPGQSTISDATSLYITHAGRYATTLANIKVNDSASWNTNFEIEQTNVVTDADLLSGADYNMNVKQVTLTITWAAIDSFVYNGQTKMRDISSIASNGTNFTTAQKESLSVSALRIGVNSTIIGVGTKYVDVDIDFEDDEPLNVGTYTPSLTISAYNGKNSYPFLHDFVLVNANDPTFTITPLTAQLSWTLDGSAKTSVVYDKTTHTARATISNLATQGTTKDTCDLTYSNDTGTNAGSYKTEVTSLSNANYKLPDDATFDWSISQKVLTFTWKTYSKSGVEKTADPTSFQYDGNEYARKAIPNELCAGDSLNIKYSVVVSENTFAKIAEVTSKDADGYNGYGKNTGAYKFTIVSLGNSNYTYSGTVFDSLKVNRRDLVYTIKDQSGTTKQSTGLKVSAPTSYTHSKDKEDWFGYGEILTQSYAKTNYGVKVIASNLVAADITNGTISFNTNLNSNAKTDGSLSGTTYEIELYNTQAGTYNFSTIISGAGQGNYISCYSDGGRAKGVKGYYTITKRVAELTWGIVGYTGNTVVYDNIDYTAKATVSNKCEGDTVVVTSSNDVKKNAEKDIVTTATSLNNDNYTLVGTTNTTYTWTIQKRILTVTWTADSDMKYDKTAKGATLVIGDALNSDTAPATLSSTNATIPTGTRSGRSWTYYITGINAGTYTTNISVVDTANMSIVTKDNNSTSRQFVIGQRTITLVWETDVNLTYSKEKKGLTVKATGGISTESPIDITGTGLSESHSYVEATEGAAAMWKYRVTAINAGTYTATAAPVSTNYVIDNASDKSKSFTIVPKTIGISWTNTTKVYDGTTGAPTASATGVETGDTVNLTMSPTQSSSKNVGSYSFSITALDNGNYQLPTNKTVTYTITPRTIAINWGTTSFTYNGKVQKPTATAGNLVTGDTCTLTYKYSNENSKNHGTYTVTASGTANSNYTIPTSDLSTSYTIAQKKLEIGVYNYSTGGSSNPNTAYDGYAHGYTIKLNNLVSGEILKLSYKLEGNPTTTRSSGSGFDNDTNTADIYATNKGTYTISDFSISDYNSYDSNNYYLASTSAKSWTISPLVITAKPVLVDTKVYDGTKNYVAAKSATFYKATDTKQETAISLVGTDYSISASYSDANVIGAKTISYTITVNNAAGNFTFVDKTETYSTSGSITGYITERVLTITMYLGNKKVYKTYDGKTLMGTSTYSGNGTGTKVVSGTVTQNSTNYRAGQGFAVSNIPAGEKSSFNISGNIAEVYNYSDLRTGYTSDGKNSITPLVNLDTYVNNVVYSGTTAETISNFRVSGSDHYKRIIFTFGGAATKSNYKLSIANYTVAGSEEVVDSGDLIIQLYDKSDAVNNPNGYGWPISINKKTITANYTNTQQSYVDETNHEVKTKGKEYKLASSELGYEYSESATYYTTSDEITFTKVTTKKAADFDQYYINTMYEEIGYSSIGTVSGDSGKVGIEIANGWIKTIDGKTRFSKYTVLSGRTTSTDLGAKLTKGTSNIDASVNYTLRNQPTLVVGYFVSYNRIDTLGSLLLATHYYSNYASFTVGYKYGWTTVLTKEAYESGLNTYLATAANKSKTFTKTDKTTVTETYSKVYEYAGTIEAFEEGQHYYKPSFVVATGEFNSAEWYYVLEGGIYSVVAGMTEFTPGTTYYQINLGDEITTYAESDKDKYYVESADWTLWFDWYQRLYLKYCEIEVLVTQYNYSEEGSDYTIQANDGCWGIYEGVPETWSESATSTKYNEFVLGANISGIYTKEDIELLDAEFGAGNWGIGKAALTNFVPGSVGSMVTAIGSFFKGTFDGTFNGDGYTIEYANIIAVNSSASYPLNIGLFEQIGTNITTTGVTGLNLRNFNIVVTDENATTKASIVNVGGIAGASSSTKSLSDVSFHGSITVVTNGAKANVGGILGSYNDASSADAYKVIDGAIVAGEISVVIKGNTTDTATSVGGIVGAINYTTNRNATVNDVVLVAPITVEIGHRTLTNIFVGAFVGSATNISSTPITGTSKYITDSVTLLQGINKSTTGNNLISSYAMNNVEGLTIDKVVGNSANSGSTFAVDYTAFRALNVNVLRAYASGNKCSLTANDIIDAYVLMNGMKQSGSVYVVNTGASWLVGTLLGTTSDRFIISSQQNVSLLRMIRFAAYSISNNIKMAVDYEDSLYWGTFYGDITSTAKITLRVNNTTEYDYYNGTSTVKRNIVRYMFAYEKSKLNDTSDKNFTDIVTVE